VTGSAQAAAILASVRAQIDTLGWIDAGERNYFAEQGGRFAYTLAYLEKVLQPGQVLVDVGSHALHFSMAARALGLDVWGADIEFFAKHPVVERRRVAAGIRETRVCDLRVASLPFENDFCDAIVFAEALEHLNFNPLPVVHEFFRVLKPGGLLLLTTPNALRAGNRLRFLAGHNVFGDLTTLCKGEIFSVHFREYSLGEVRQLFEWGGFHVVDAQSRYLYPVGGVRKLVKAAIESIAPQLAGNLFVVGRK
jgi:SAM-dependent methyltransferase